MDSVIYQLFDGLLSVPASIIDFLLEEAFNFYKSQDSLIRIGLGALLGIVALFGVVSLVKKLSKLIYILLLIFAVYFVLTNFVLV